MADPTEVYSVKFDADQALDALKQLEKMLVSVDKRARSLFTGATGDQVSKAVKEISRSAKPASKNVDGIDAALKRTSDRALAMRAKFEQAQARIADVTTRTTKRVKAQTDRTKDLTDAGKNLDAMMRKFSRNASTGQRRVEKAIEGTRKAVERTDTALKKVPKSARKASRGFHMLANQSAIATQSVSGLALKLSAMIGAAAGIRDVVDEYKGFDQAATSAVAKFSKLEPALQPGTQAFKDFKKEIREARRDTEHSAEGAARAVDFWAKAGKTSEQSKAVLETTLNFASANQDASGSMLDVARAGDILSDALGQFNLNADDSATLMANTARVSDVMTAAANSANVSAEELFEAFGKGGPAMTAVGRDIEEASSLLAAMANNGIKGSRAGNQLNIALSALNAPSKKQASLLKKLDISVKDSAGNFKGLTSVIGEINAATSEMGTAERFEVFSTLIGREGSSAFIGLLSQGQTALDSMTESLRGANGETKRLAEMMRSSGAAQIDTFKNDLRDLGFEIIEETGVIGHLTGAVKSIDWKKAYDVIRTDVIPALKTFGGIVTGTIIPGLQRAYEVVSTVLTPVISLLSVAFGKLSGEGKTLSKILGDMIALWVAYRGYLLAVKATNMAKWFIDLAKQIAGTTAAQGALNTQTAATNATLGKSVKQFGLLKSAAALFAAGVAGWEIGTVIHDQVVEPLAKAQHELALLNAEVADTMGRDVSKRSHAQLKRDIETVDKFTEGLKEDAILSNLPGMGFFQDAQLLAAKKEKERLTAAKDAAYYRERKEGQSFIEQFEDETPTGVFTPEAFDTAPMQAPIPLAPLPESPRVSPEDTARYQESVREQTEIAKQKALTDAEYQRQSLEALRANAAPAPVNQNIEVGPTTINMEVKSSDPAAIAREVKRQQDLRDKNQRLELLDGARAIGPVEI